MHGSSLEAVARRDTDVSTGAKVLSSLTPSSSSVSKKVPDPYKVMQQGRTEALRITVGNNLSDLRTFGQIPPSLVLDEHHHLELKQAFTNAPICEVATNNLSHAHSDNPGRKPVVAGGLADLPSKQRDAAVPLETISFRVTKIGVLQRKYGKKFRSIGVILTSTQLLWFRDTEWTESLEDRIRASLDHSTGTLAPNGTKNVRVTPLLQNFRPNEISNLAPAFAVVQEEEPCSFHLHLENGGQQCRYLIKASDPESMEDWIRKINYCSVYRWCGIRKVDRYLADQQILLHRIQSQDETTSLYPASTIDESQGRSSSIRSATPSRMSSKTPFLSHTTSPTESDLKDAPWGSSKLYAAVNEYDADLIAWITLAQGSRDRSEATMLERIRLARHLQLSTPLPKHTRDRLEARATDVVKDLVAARLEWLQAKYRLGVLEYDLITAHQAGVDGWLKTYSYLLPPGMRPSITGLTIPGVPEDSTLVHRAPPSTTHGGTSRLISRSNQEDRPMLAPSPSTPLTATPSS